MNPFAGISRPDIDIVWIRFGEIIDDDVAILQEVKTTGDPLLLLADNLISDYDKLFGTDLRFTLHTRLQEIKNKLEYSVAPQLIVVPAPRLDETWHHS